MAKEEWINKIVKLKSGRLGIVLSVKTLSNITFITIQVPGMGIITMRTNDVEKIE